MARRQLDERGALPIIVAGGEPEHRGEPTSVARPHTRRTDLQILAVAAVAALGVVASIVLATDTDDPQPGTTTRPPVLSPIAAPGSDSFTGPTEAITPTRRTRTAVGTIAWTRYDGGTELPARVDVDAEGRLVGLDELVSLRPIDGASRWLRQETIERTISGDLWRLRHAEGSLGLGIVTPIGRQTIELTDLVEPLPGGFVAAVEPVLGLSDGFPIDLDGDVFLLASTRVGLPWAEIARPGPEGAYRVELSDGQRSIRFAQGRFNEMPVEEFRLVRGVGTTHHVHDAAGEPVWSFDVDGGQPAIEAAVGRFETTWLRWNGSRFVAIERPWPDWHDVEMVPVGGGVLARSDGPRHREVALWHSDDGYAWTSVELPAERIEGTPVSVQRDGDGAIVTMFAGGSITAWATRDGMAFARLPDVPGVAERRRGDFGWIAAHPRSAPTLRLSADGTSWEELDIGPLLGLEASRWDVTITAAADRDRIVVVADRPDGRSVLVGAIVTDGSR